MAIEKLHPVFFHFDTASFADRLGRTVRGAVKLVLGVRSPLDVFRSFLSYQVRNPGWYGGKQPADVLRDMERSLVCMLELSTAMGHVLVRYESLRDDYPATLERVLAFACPGWAPSPSLLSAVRDATDRSRRGPGSPFLRTGPFADQVSGHLLDAFPRELSRLDSLHAELLDGARP